MKNAIAMKKPTRVVGGLLACASITGLYILVFSPKGEGSMKDVGNPPQGHTAPKSTAPNTPNGTLVTARLSFEVK
jgi:hypothetical protein